MWVLSNVGGDFGGIFGIGILARRKEIIFARVEHAVFSAEGRVEMRRDLGGARDGGADLKGAHDGQERVENWVVYGDRRINWNNAGRVAEGEGKRF
jgi:hypothetical protein